jgi:hypothetical protein
MQDMNVTPPPGSSSWKDELHIFLDVVRRTEIPVEQAREEYNRVLQQTISEEIYPAFEEFLGEMTRLSIAGQIYGRTSPCALVLKLEDGFEVAVERDRYREQTHLMPRLILVTYSDEAGRHYGTTQGIAWDRIKKAEVLGRLVDEYKRFRVQRRSTRLYGP